MKLRKKKMEITKTKQKDKPVLSTRICRWSTDDKLLKVGRLKDADGVANEAFGHYKCFYLFILFRRFHLKHRRDFTRSKILQFSDSPNGTRECLGDFFECGMVSEGSVF